MKILLVNLPWRAGPGSYNIRAGSRWPHQRDKALTPYYPFPFSLAYAAAVLKQEGFDTTLKDCIAEEAPREEFLKFFLKMNPDIIVAEVATASFYNDLEILKKAKELSPDIKTILCGPHVSARPEEALKEPFVDFVLRGEYEGVLRQLMHWLPAKDIDYNLDGLCAKNQQQMVINGYAKLREDIDSLPYPDRESLPLEKYYDPFCKDIPNLQMVTSRGCPYGCIFCLEPWVFYGRPNYRVRTPSAVVDEMGYLAGKYRAGEIYFDDSSFSVNQERVIEICRQIKIRNLKINWSCMADAHLNRQTLSKMKDAGCVAIKFGVESASAQILKYIKKHINLADALRLVKDCKDLGIATHAAFMFGFPGETKQAVSQTRRFAFSLKTTTAQFSLAIPFPGTPFFQQLKDDGLLITQDWSKYDGRQVIIRNNQVSPQYLLKTIRDCRQAAILKVFLSPRYALRYIRLLYKYLGFKGFIYKIIQIMKFLFQG